MRAAWWWIDRWRKSTAYTDMTLAEQGAYRNLLDELWLRDGVIPNDERILAKVCGDPFEWATVREKVLARFRLTPEGWRNDTHDEVSGGSKGFRAAQAEKGRKGAEARWRHSANGPANGPANSPANGLPSPSPSPSPLVVSDGSRKVGENEPPTLPPADRTERAIRLSTDALRTKLYGLIDQAVRLDPKKRDPTELMRLFTSYEKQDGTWVKGVVNASLLSHERLERSIKDAEEQIEDWNVERTERQQDGSGHLKIRRLQGGVG